MKVGIPGLITFKHWAHTNVGNAIGISRDAGMQPRMGLGGWI